MKKNETADEPGQEPVSAAPFKWYMDLRKFVIAVCTCHAVPFIRDRILICMHGANQRDYIKDKADINLSLDTTKFGDHREQPSSFFQGITSDSHGNYYADCSFQIR